MTRVEEGHTGAASFDGVSSGSVGKSKRGAPRETAHSLLDQLVNLLDYGRHAPHAENLEHDLGSDHGFTGVCFLRGHHAIVAPHRRKRAVA